MIPLMTEEDRGGCEESAISWGSGARGARRRVQCFRHEHVSRPREEPAVTQLDAEPVATEQTQRQRQTCALALSPVTGLVPCSRAAPLKGKLGVICTSEPCPRASWKGQGPGSCVKQSVCHSDHARASGRLLPRPTG